MLTLDWFKDANRRFRNGWILTLVLPAALCAQPTVGGLPEDLLPELKPILQSAMERSPQMISSAINLAQAEANRYGTDAPLWPSLGGSAGYGQNSASTSSDTGNSSSSTGGFSYSIGVGQPIFQWGALKYRADIGRIAVKIAERQYADAYRALAGTIRSQYLTLIYKHASVRSAQDSMRMASNSLAIEEARFKEGTISSGELIPPRMTFAEAQLAADRAVADFNASRRVFMRLVGLKALPETAIPFDVPAPTYSAATATQLVQSFVQQEGAASTFQGQVYLMTLRQADLNYRIARTGLLPKFSLAGSYGLSFSTSVDSAGNVNTSAVKNKSYGVNASWTIFDGFATRGAKLSALASKRATERQYQTYLETTVDTLQNSQEQLEFSARALALAEQRHGLAQDAVNHVAEDFKAGLASQSAMDTANSNLLGANATIIYARADFLNRWADFVSQTGADPVIANLPARYVRSTK
jgi:outer membrane protein TolC